MTMKKYLAGFLIAVVALSGWFVREGARAGVTCTLPFNLLNGTTADATQVMANYNQLVTCFTSAAAAGANNDITALLGLTTPISPSAGGSNVFIGVTSTGSANGQVISSTTPIGFSLTNGYTVVFNAGFTNTASPTTLNVNGTGATNTYKPAPGGAELLTGGEIKAGNLTVATYSSTLSGYQIMPQNQAGGSGLPVTIAAATITSLAAAVDHAATITGNTTITGFGSGGDLNYPIYRLTFTGAPLLTYSATAPQLLLQGAGNIQAAAGDTATAAYLGGSNWQIIDYVKANGTAVINPTPLAGFLGLSIKNNAGTPATQIDWSSASAVLINPTGNVPTYVTSVSGTINLTNGTVTSTCNGMDGEVRGTSRWLYLYMINNGTTTCGLASSSSSAPTLPSGYTFVTYMGAMSVDGSGNLLNTIQKGNIGHWTGGAVAGQVPCQIGSGTIGTYSVTSPSLTATTVLGNGDCAPPTATAVNVIGSTNWKAAGGANILVAPNTSGYSGSNNGPEGTNGVTFPIWSTATDSRSAWIVLESTTLGLASSNSGGAFFLSEWKDLVNAN